MSYKIKTFGNGIQRRDYKKSSGKLEPFDLLEIQKTEFKKFMDQGIDEVFREVYPVYSTKEKLKVEYLGYKIEMPENHEQEIKDAKNKGSNYSFVLKAKFRMINLKEGTKVEEKEAFIANIPLMTEGASFIVNGSERTIISQIVRAPGSYFEELKTSRSQTTSDASIFKVSTIIPNRGSWIEFDYKDYKLLGTQPVDIKVKIDKSKRIKVMNLLNGFGLSDSEILELFSNHELIVESINKIKPEEKNPFEARKSIFKIIRSGDRFSEKFINEALSNLLFNKKRYDLSETGRFKFNNKLSFEKRILNKTLAAPINDAKGNVLFEKDTFMDKENVEKLMEEWRKWNIEFSNYSISDEIYGPEFADFSEEDKKKFSQVHIAKIYDDNNNPISILSIVYSELEHLTISDIISTLGYFINLEQGVLKYDDIDSLSNRKIRTVYELLKNQLRIGLIRIEKNLRERISAKDTSNVTIKNATNYKLMEQVLKEFFNSSQLSQFMDQINPLAEISNKRRITSLGPGGLSRDTASIVVRGIHDTHYGRIDPIETPEGPNIGLILNLTIYSRINKYGLLETPYYKVTNGKIDKKNPIFFDVEMEIGKKIASGNVRTNDSDEIIDEEVIVRHDGSFINVPIEEVEYIEVSPKQIVSIATSHIPFLENDDANRALMGANMQRQAVPLIKTDSPIVGTGIEEISAKYSPTTLVAKEDGELTYVDSEKMIIKGENEVVYNLHKFTRTNQGTLINQIPVKAIGTKIKKGEVIADGPSTDNGEMAIGKNVVVAFTTWRGYNYEDAIILSERLVKDDVFTSIHIEEYIIEQRSTRLGNEKITTDIPNISKESMRNLDSEGVVVVGSKVTVGDILVGKITPKGEDDLSPEEKLLDAILGNKTLNVKDSSLRVPYSGEGIVQNVNILSRENGDKLDDGVDKIIKVYIAQKRKIKEGDKMSGRHGNKGVVSKILPIQDMPYLPDGTPVDVMLNPLGVPSRMNIGQLLEMHLGMAAKELGVKVSTPIFNGVNNEDLEEIIKEAGFDETGKFDLVDGMTGQKFDDKVTVGVMYMLKLSHMIDDKMHARSIGPYSLITQQPLRGKSQNGGQRFGEMEAWALEAYGASNLLQEMSTLKSDDIKGRNELYNAIAKGKKIPTPNIPEGFWVLYYELKGLGLNLHFYDNDDNEMEIDNSI